MKMPSAAGPARLASLRSSFGKCFRSVALLAATLSLNVSSPAVQLLPGVYGYGLNRGTLASPVNSAGFGEDSDIIYVTNTNNSGAGSLRAALADTSDDPRVIVFTTSGVITLESNLTLARGNRTIAGQTAPWPGITIRGASLIIGKDNVLVQHLRIRPGDEFNGVDTHNRDAVRVEGGTNLDPEKGTVYNPVENVVFDHCTFSWTLDEAVSLWNTWDAVTFNRCIFAEPLDVSIHLDEGTLSGNDPKDDLTPTDKSGFTTVDDVNDTEAIGNQYQVLRFDNAGDYADYEMAVVDSGSSRLSEHIVVGGFSGTDRGKFQIEVRLNENDQDAYWTSDIIDQYASSADAGRKSFVGRPGTEKGGGGFTIPAHQTTLYIRIYARTKNASSSGQNISVDVLSLSQGHGMGPLIAWGGDAEAKMAFTGSIFTHFRERGPWVYPQQLLFANNVLYNRTRYWLMLGHAAEGEHDIATMKAEVVGNKIIEGKSWGVGYPEYGPFRNMGLAQPADDPVTAQLHFSDNSWDTGNFPTVPTEFSNFEDDEDIDNDSRIVSSNPISQTEGMAGFSAVTSAQAFNNALLQAGARPAERDSAERRVMNEVAQSIHFDWDERPGDRADSVEQAGGWPAEWFQENSSTWTAPSPSVANTDPDGNGYTVIEEWLHQLAAQVEGVVPEGAVYVEAFAGTAPALDWTPVTGTWSETGGAYAQTENIPSAISVYNGGTWTTDYTVSAQLFNDWTGTGNRVGLVYNYVNSSNYSYVTFNTSGLVEVTRVTGGGSPQVIASGTYAGGGDAIWFQASVRRRGNMTAVLVNGVPCLPNVWEPGLGAGKVGLFTRSNITGKFDDFQVLATTGGGTAFNDFEDLSTSGWSLTGDGSWQLPLDGSTRVWQQALDTATTPFATLDNSHSTDHSIIADVKHVSFGTSGWYGVFARYTDADNYYYVKISGSTAEIKKMVGGSFSTLDSVSYTPSTSVFRTLQFVVEGSGSTDLKLYIDGALVCSFTDSSGLPAGKAGLLAYHANVKYDNVSISPVAGGTVLVADDFAGGDGNWNELSGSWAVSSGWYRQSATTNTDSRTHQGGAVTNQSVEADARALQNPLPTNKWFGVLARFTDANNYYYLILRQNNMVELKKIVGGSFSLLDDASFTVAPNTTYTLKLEVIGTALRGYVNGQLLVRANDTSLPSGTNGAALMTSGLSAEFDDVLVTAP